MTFCLTHDPAGSNRIATVPLHPATSFRAFTTACRPPPRLLTTLLLRLLERHLAGLRSIEIGLRNRLTPPGSASPSFANALPNPPQRFHELPGMSSHLPFDPLGDAVLTHGLDAFGYQPEEPRKTPPLELLHSQAFVQIDLNPRLRPSPVPHLSKHAEEVVRRRTSISANAALTAPATTLSSPIACFRPVALFLVSRDPNS